jgi:hypothetical protein
MKRYVLYIVAVLLTFALGVAGASALRGHGPDWLMALGILAVGPLTLGAAAVCYRQSLRGERGPRRSVAYNMLMLNAAALLFAVGLILSVGVFAGLLFS